MSDAEIDQARLLATEDHFDREPERRLGFRQKGLGVLRYAQRACSYRAHRRTREPAQPLGEAGKGLERPGFGHLINAPIPRETGSEAHRITQTVQKVDLIVDDPADLQVEAVGSQVKRGQCLLFHSCRADPFERRNDAIIMPLPEINKASVRAYL